MIWYSQRLKKSLNRVKKGGTRARFLQDRVCTGIPDNERPSAFFLRLRVRNVYFENVCYAIHKDGSIPNESHHRRNQVLSRPYGR